MITLHSLETVLPVVKQAKTTLTPIPGSGLAQLTDPLKTKMTVCLNSDTFPRHENERGEIEVDTTQLLQMINEISKDNACAYEDHQTTLDELSTKVAHIMRNNIYLARTLVIPLIEEFTEKTATEIDKVTNLASLALNVIVDKKLEILFSPQLRNLVKGLENRTNFDIKIPKFHPQELNQDELLAALKTGNKSFDEQAHDWIVANNLLPMVESVYSEVFKKGAVVSGRAIFERYIKVDDFDYAVIAMLLAMGLPKNIQDDINVDAKEYGLIMEAFASACASRIAQFTDKIDRGNKQGRLVLLYPASNLEFAYNNIRNNNIVVNKVLYERYLANGGKVEAIMGAYLKDRNVNYDTILTNQEEYIKEYNRVVNRKRLIASNEKIFLLRDLFKKYSNEVVERISEYTGNSGNGDEIVVSFIEENVHIPEVGAFINKIHEADLKDINDLVQRFICQCFFKNTIVAKLLNNIDIIDPNHESDINEVALVATTDLIVDWFVSQLETQTNTISTEGYYI